MRLCLPKNLVKQFSTNIVSSKARKVQIPKVPLHEYLWKNLEKWPDKTATVCFETQRTYTYHELYKESLSVTRFLNKSLKLKKGETVAVVLPNILEYPIILLGAIQAGLKVTTCNPNYTKDEIQKQLETSESALVFTSTNLVPLVRQAVGKINRTIPIVEVARNGVSNGNIDFREISSGDVGKPVDVNLEQTVILPYSSGTTGLPKGVELTHSNIVSNLCQATSPEFLLLENQTEDVVPCFLPFFHIYGLVQIMMQSLRMGSKLVVMPAFTSENFIKLLRNFKPTVVYGVPLVVMMSNNNPNIKGEDFASVRILVSGAAPLGITDVEKFRTKTNNKVNLYQGYGLTETSTLTHIQTNKLPNGIKIGGSGLLLPNIDAKVIPTDGASLDGLGPNQSGELLMRGPQVMKGYFNNPQATQEVILDGGWLKTGDIAHYDEDDQFYITDRLKELIKVKGFQVAPAELEEILRDYPGVAEAAVVGVPHSSLGEAPKAFITAKSGESVNVRVLEEFVASKVAQHKRLVGGVVLVDSIPKTPSGKILRRELKKM